MEKMEKPSVDLEYFGDGTFDKPKIMFYFTKPCPELQIEAAQTLPDFGTRPAFQFGDGNFKCDLCGKKFFSGMEMVKHWQEETQGSIKTFKDAGISSVEVKPGMLKTADIVEREGTNKDDKLINTNTNPNVTDYQHELELNTERSLVNVKPLTSETTDDIEKDGFDNSDEPIDAIEKDGFGNSYEPVDSIEKDGLDNCGEPNYSTEKDGFDISDEPIDKDGYDNSDVPNESIEKDGLDISDEPIDSIEKDGFTNGDEPIDSIKKDRFDDSDEASDSIIIKSEVVDANNDFGNTNHENNETDIDIIKSEKKEFVFNTLSSDRKLFELNVENRKKYKCKYDNCDYLTGHRSLLRRHIKHTHELIRYDCSFCSDARSIGRDGLRKHIKRNHKEISFNLKEHPSYQISEEELAAKPSFQCDTCDFNARSAWHVKKHMRSEHLNNSSMTSVLKVEPKAKEYFKEGDDYICKSCDHKTKILDSLRMHIKRKHSEVSCTVCQFRAENYDSLKKHSNTEHQGILFLCQYCDKNLVSNEGLKRHLLHHHSEKNDDDQNLLACKKCNFQTKGRNNLRKHMNMAHVLIKSENYNKDENDYVCKFCDHRTHILDSLRMHIKRKHTEKSCSFCDFKAKDYASLKDHALADHQGIMSKCEFCEKNILSAEGLRRHMLHFHAEKCDENSSLLSCDQCLFQAYGKYKLKRHMEAVHRKEVDYEQCHLCDYTGKSRLRVKQHVESVHEGKKVTKNIRNTTACDKCDYTCSGKSKLALHMGIKHEVDSQIFYCDQCEFKSKYITSVNNHKKYKHDGEAFSCDYCDFNTTIKQVLNDHIDDKHLGIKKECDECDYAAASTMCLNLHKNAKHRGIKYPCDQCDYKATQRGTLALHKKAKHQNVRFDCEQCDFTASFKGNLRSHMKTKHGSIIKTEENHVYDTTAISHL